MKQRAAKLWREWMRPILVILLITSAFRSAMADWNDVPSGSMKPTIMEGDRIFINKLAYDLKIPFTTIRIARWGDPMRGDVVVLFSPYDGKRLVKRVVGMPGDTIEMHDSVLLINGKRVRYSELDPRFSGEIPPEQQPRYAFFAENLEGKEHPVMITPLTMAVRTFGPVRIPEGQYFVMGDNRDNSLDSRFFGTVKRGQIIGRAVAVVASVNPEDHYLPRWHRWFTRLP